MATFRWPAWDPLSGLRYMQREFERLMGRSIFSDLQQRIGGGVYPPVNVFTGPDSIVVQCEVAGLSHEELDLSITGETLVIKGTKKPPANEDTLHFQRRERGLGEFNRTIVLPDKVDPDRVEARLDSGVLQVTLPKSEAARPRQIPVK